MLIELVALCTFYVVFPPFIFIVTLTLVLASVGQSLGVRRLYIDVLLKVFEVSRSFIVGSVIISFQYARDTKNTKEQIAHQNGFVVGNEIPDSESDEGQDVVEYMSFLTLLLIERFAKYYNFIMFQRIHYLFLITESRSMFMYSQFKLIG